MSDSKPSGSAADTLDIVGRAIGFALAVYDQTQAERGGGPLDRINKTRALLTELSEAELFTPGVEAVIDAVCAGLSQYSLGRQRDQTGGGGGGRHLL